jgi:hypothetical protein
MNSTRLQARLTDESGRVARLAKSDAPPEEVVEELYLAAYSRLPHPDEKAIAMQVIQTAGENRKSAIEDLLWALLNSAEFVFNH